jgi:hypothetical protein
MRYHRNTLLAGIAALALVAGTGLASAQESSKDQSPQGKQPHATQQMNHAPAAGKMGQRAQDQNRGSVAHQSNQRAEESNRANKADKAATGESRKAGAKAERDETKAGKSDQDKSAQDRDRTRTDRRNTAQDRDRMKGQNAAAGMRNGKAAQEQNRNGRENTTAAQRERNGMEGLQGNASGMHAQLTDEQRTRIRSTVINAAGAPRVGRVDFDVTVGTVIPRDRIHVAPVPETLVRIEPEWRGFLYFVYEDEVVIVNPRDMRIVAVVPA